MVQCPVCLELTLHPVHLQCHTDHLCYSCFKQHVMLSVQDISYRSGGSVKCPVCTNSPISIESVVSLLNIAHAETLQELLLKQYLRTTKDIHRCPLSTCTFAGVQSGACLFPQAVDCPVCFTSLYKRFSFDIITPIITLIYITFFTNNCPSCQIPIERISGCPHMTCTCKHQFCWFCRKDHYYSPASMYRAHQNGQCFSLFLIRAATIVLATLSLALGMYGVEGFNVFVDYMARVGVIAGQVIVVDGFILIQIALVINICHSRFKKYLKFLGVGLSAVDVLIVNVLEWLGYLPAVMYIVGLTIVVGLIIAAIVSLIVYSNNTWFQYIS